MVMKNRVHNPKNTRVDRNFIAVAGKLFSVLEYFISEGARQQSISVQEMSKALPLARTTLHRILHTLERLAYVEKGEGKARYRLGPRFFELTEPAVHFRKLQSVAKSIMLELMIRYGETVNLGVIDEGQVDHIEVIQSPSALRIAAHPGDRNPVHSTALGKVIMAFLPEDAIDSIFQDYPMIRMTPKTITQRTHFLKHLALVREQGIAFDLGENIDGVTCVAAPVFDRQGHVVAGLSISGPTSRMEAKMADLQEDVRKSGLAISRMLGNRTHEGGVGRISTDNG
jgi:IclR family transcriptional regulator, KDG regulon repressor